METIQGYVDHFIYYNESNGYGVVQLTTEDEEIVCVGSFQGFSQGAAHFAGAYPLDFAADEGCDKYNHTCGVQVEGQRAGTLSGVEYAAYFQNSQCLINWRTKLGSQNQQDKNQKDFFQVFYRNIVALRCYVKFCCTAQ